VSRTKRSKTKPQERSTVGQSKQEDQVQTDLEAVATNSEGLPSSTPEPQVLEPEYVLLSDLVAHPRNYREHPPDQILHLVQSMREHGVYRNVVIARDGHTILAGHGVTLAARQAGLEKILAVKLNCDPDEPLALKLVAGDNEIAHLGEINDRTLTELLREIKDSGVDGGLLGTGFDEAMLMNLLMVTRPASEILDHGEAAEWVGMPEYEEGGVHPQLIITFGTVEDRDRFVTQTEIKVADAQGSTWSTRWPFDRADQNSVRFE